MNRNEVIENYEEILSDLEQLKEIVESRITHSKQHGEGAFECCVEELKEIIGE